MRKQRASAAFVGNRFSIDFYGVLESKFHELLNTDPSIQGSIASEILLLDNITQEWFTNSKLGMINFNYYSIYFKSQCFHLQIKIKK